MAYNTMKFEEADELRRVIDNDDIYDNVVSYTDYDHREINHDIIFDLLQNLNDDEMKDEYSFTADELVEALENALGKEVYDDLMNGKLDFISVIY